MEHFMELYQTVYADLYRLAYYYMGNAQDAEDAVQDAALAACEHFDRLKKEASFRPWIFRILVNRCRTVLKKKTAGDSHGGTAGVERTEGDRSGIPGGGIGAFKDTE